MPSIRETRVYRCCVSSSVCLCVAVVHRLHPCTGRASQGIQREEGSGCSTVDVRVFCVCAVVCVWMAHTCSVCASSSASAECLSACSGWTQEWREEASACFSEEQHCLCHCAHTHTHTAQLLHSSWDMSGDICVCVALSAVPSLLLLLSEGRSVNLRCVKSDRAHICCPVFSSSAACVLCSRLCVVCVQTPSWMSKEYHIKRFRVLCVCVLQGCDGGKRRSLLRRLRAHTRCMCFSLHHCSLCKEWCVFCYACSVCVASAASADAICNVCDGFVCGERRSVEERDMRRRR